MLGFAVPLVGSIGVGVYTKSFAYGLLAWFLISFIWMVWSIVSGVSSMVDTAANWPTSTDANWDGTSTYKFSDGGRVEKSVNDVYTVAVTSPKATAYATEWNDYRVANTVI